MKKEQRKKQSAKTKKQPDNSFVDLGIEPPKLYRDAQKSIVSRQEQRDSRPRSNKKPEITRAQKRQRDNKKRKTKNLFRKVLIWFVAIVAFLSVGTVLSLTVFFQTTDITVQGNKRYTADEVLSHCTIDVGENLFLADTKSTKAMLEKNLPYIYNAEIKRKLPYTIEINITEAKPAYSIKNKDKSYILLDSNFKVLEDKAKKGAGIRISKAQITSAVVGTTIEFKDEDIVNCLNTLAEIIKKNHFDEITAIYCNNIADNHIIYDGRIDFKLGTLDNIENKIYQGLAACDKLEQTSPNAHGTMDISGGKSLYFTEK